MHLDVPPVSLSRSKWVLILCCALINCQTVDAQRDALNFEKIILDDLLQGGYGVELADIDGDSLLDVVALSTSPARLVWYKNPRWERYAISSAGAGNIATAANDIDGDGDIDLVLASGFSLSESTTGGLIQWLENSGSPEDGEEWKRHSIDQIPTTHRIMWADINGIGNQELIVLPIIGVGAQPPDYDISLTLRAYAIPENLKLKTWPSVVLDNTLQLSHGMAVSDWSEDGREDILTASFYGVHLFQLASRGQAVAKKLLARGNQADERPNIGSSEVDVGMLAAGKRFIATIEPWHGNEVVVYTAGENVDALWNREVIADDYSNGHGLLVADLDNDGNDEIIAGSRSKPYQLFIHRFDNDTLQCQRNELDAGGVAVSGLAIADINADGFRDIVAIGNSTGNVVYYQNYGRQ
jgi:hypothetical protein